MYAEKKFLEFFLALISHLLRRMVTNLVMVLQAGLAKLIGLAGETNVQVIELIKFCTISDRHHGQ